MQRAAILNSLGESFKPTPMDCEKFCDSFGPERIHRLEPGRFPSRVVAEEDS
jgi:hypothetical protein